MNSSAAHLLEHLGFQCSPGVARGTDGAQHSLLQLSYLHHPPVRFQSPRGQLLPLVRSRLHRAQRDTMVSTAPVDASGTGGATCRAAYVTRAEACDVAGRSLRLLMPGPSNLQLSLGQMLRTQCCEQCHSMDSVATRLAAWSGLGLVWFGLVGLVHLCCDGLI